MYDYKKDLEKIKNPENIREAVFASSPYVLRKVFENDVIVRRLINVGQDVAPLITEELKNNNEKLHEITLSCFAFILQKVDPPSAKKVLKPLLTKAMKRPGPFFVHFTAHSLLENMNLPLSREKMTFTKDELQDIVTALEQEKKKQKR